eukprot:3776701-Prorocentrum_lima.AAC.1
MCIRDSQTTEWKTLHDEVKQEHDTSMLMLNTLLQHQGSGEALIQSGLVKLSKNKLHEGKKDT